jgi:hypothetical protein
MKVVCAWCKQEGRGGMLGECEPFDDKSETHGICGRHSQTMLEQLPSHTFPGIRVLLVVHHSEPGLYEHLTRSFATLRDVAVVLDRRLNERRKMPPEGVIERRRANRRIRRSEFSSLGYYVVRFGPERAVEVRKFPALVRRAAQ